MKHSKDSKTPSFQASTGLTTREAEALLVKFGKNELEDKQKPKWLIFIEQVNLCCVFNFS